MKDGLLTAEEMDFALKTYDNDFISKPEQYIDFIKNYALQNNLKSIVIGLSGGIDSTLCSILCRIALNNTNVKLIGISLPCKNGKLEVENANKCKSIVDIFEEININDMYNNFLTLFSMTNSMSNIDNTVANGNLQARIRMIILYNVAKLNSGIVMSTDNLTELLTGFWTLHGDVGDISPLQWVWKTQVYKMANYILVNKNKYDLTKEMEDALISAINILPTDGLGITKTDTDQMDCKSYQEVDYIFYRYFLGVLGTKPKVISMYENSFFKRENPLHFVPRIK